MKKQFSCDPLLKMLYFREKGSTIPKKYYDGRHAMLMSVDFWYRDGEGRLWWPNQGFIFDGGSIPRMFWDEIGGPFEFYLPAYLIHDWICRHAAGRGKRYNHELREIADNVFKEMLLVLGCPKGKAQIMYLAVRSAGMLED